MIWEMVVDRSKNVNYLVVIGGKNKDDKGIGMVINMTNISFWEGGPKKYESLQMSQDGMLCKRMFKTLDKSKVWWL